MVSNGSRTIILNNFPTTGVAMTPLIYNFEKISRLHQQTWGFRYNMLQQYHQGGQKNVARRDVVAQEFTIRGAGKILKCKVREVPVYVNNFNYVYKSIIYIIITIYLQRWCISQRSATLSICNSMSMPIKFTKFSKIFPPSISQDQSELEQKNATSVLPYAVIKHGTGKFTISFDDFPT